MFLESLIYYVSYWLYNGILFIALLGLVVPTIAKFNTRFYDRIRLVREVKK